MKKFLSLLLLLIPFPAFAETWSNGCNTCTGERDGVYQCTAMYCMPDSSKFILFEDPFSVKWGETISVDGRKVGYRGDGVVVWAWDKDE